MAEMAKGVNGEFRQDRVTRQSYAHCVVFTEFTKGLSTEYKSVSVIISAIDSIRWARQTALMESLTENILVKSVLNVSRRILGKPESPKEPLRLEII